jgi:ABC-type transporter MlaC component
MSQANPDKRTIIAAAIYGISEQVTTETRKGVVALPWASLSPEQQKPFVDAAEFVSAQMFGTDINTVDRKAITTALEKSFRIKDAETIVSVAINVTSALA